MKKESKRLKKGQRNRQKINKGIIYKVQCTSWRYINSNMELSCQ